MQLRRFGSTALRVSPVGLGTVNLSWFANEADSFAILDAAFEAGVNLIDTADSYNAGMVEELLGRWLAQRPGRREKLMLASKVYLPPTEWGSPDPVKRSGSWVGPNQRGLSAKHIREACEGSLKRMGTDYIDLYQMHHVDRTARWEEVWQALELLVQQGKTIYCGSSNFAAYHIAQAQETAKRRNGLGLVSEESVYSLVRRTVELEVLPAVRDYGMAFLAWSPLAGGMLGGRPEDNARGRRGFRTPTEPMTKFFALCDEIGHPPGMVALSWLAHQDSVTPLLGPRTTAQLASGIAAVDLTLDEATLKRIDEIFPGPGRPAPEAYAW